MMTIPMTDTEIVQAALTEIEGVLKGVVARPGMYTATKDGMESMVWVCLGLKATLHGKGERDLARKSQQKYAPGVTPMFARDGYPSLEDFGRYLQGWIDTFNATLVAENPHA